MKTEIQVEGLVPDRALMAFVKRHVADSFGALENRIERVQVRLTAVNEALRGVDQCCRVEVAFGGRFKAVVETRETDLRSAARRALERAGWTVARKLRRPQGLQPGAGAATGARRLAGEQPPPSRAA